MEILYEFWFLKLPHPNLIPTITFFSGIFISFADLQLKSVIKYVY